MYADNVQIYLLSSGVDLVRTMDKINHDLKNISQWAEQNCLLINPQKTQAILFSKKIFDTTNLNIRLNNNIVEWQDKVKNLGLYMDKYFI